MITYRKLGQMGRFAAQICEYVGVRLYAEAHGFSYTLPDWAGTRVFTGMRAWLPSERIIAGVLPTVQLDDLTARSRRSRVWAALGWWRYSSMRELYRHPRDYINLYGYLIDDYSLDLYRAHRNRIRSWFTWQPDIEKAFRDATRGMSWVGLHVRRRDYVKIRRTLPVQTYLDALTRIRHDLPVYLATDDPEVRRELDSEMLLDVRNPLPDLYMYVPGDLFDFWMLQHATTVIGGGSTFPWWAAFLGTDNEFYAPPLTHLWGKSHVPPPPITRQML